jgi:FkbM family methyltransferase
MEFGKLIDTLKLITEKVIPVRYQLAVRYSYLKKTNKLDEELFYVSKLLKSKRRFLDIGANVGIYSYYFKNIFDKVDAFEPLSEITHRLRSIHNGSLNVHNVALSNKIGELQFYIPIINGKTFPQLASLEKRDGDCEVRTVKVETVDCHDFDDVDLIKIDVEGHERFVIEGALKVIKKNMPILIIEIEQRHIEFEIHEVFRSILSLNYSGFFLQKGILTSLKEFSYELNQKPFLENVEDKEYINNFIFIPNKHT